MSLDLLSRSDDDREPRHAILLSTTVGKGIMSLDALQSVARELVDKLALGDYELLVERCAKSNLTSDDVRKLIRDYGRRFVSPPDDAYKKLDAVQVKGAAVPTWSVRVPLWTEEEGRSDLTLELTIALRPDGPSFELDDLHVL
jgi:hypothetical protein